MRCATSERQQQSSAHYFSTSLATLDIHLCIFEPSSVTTTLRCRPFGT